MKKATLINTSRLILSQISLSDADDIQASANVPEIANAMISIPHPYLAGEAIKYIRQQLAEFDIGTSNTFTIRLASDNSFSGVVEIRDIDRQHQQAELSFWLAVDAWGNGYMKEVVAAILKYSFSSLKLNRIYVYHMIRNPASGNVLERNGFKREGILRERVLKNGKFEDVALLAVLRRDRSARANV